MSHCHSELRKEFEEELRYDEVQRAHLKACNRAFGMVEEIKKTNKYQRECKGILIDVYDVLKAFNVTNPAQQHAIKKMLAPGQRGVKDFKQDLQEAIDSLSRAVELGE